MCITPTTCANLSVQRRPWWYLQPARDDGTANKRLSRCSVKRVMQSTEAVTVQAVAPRSKTSALTAYTQLYIEYNNVAGQQRQQLLTSSLKHSMRVLMLPHQLRCSGSSSTATSASASGMYCVMSPTGRMLPAGAQQTTRERHTQHMRGTLYTT